MEPVKTAGQIALQEAWEEAGLLGTLRGEPVGTYYYEKLARQHIVLVYLMLVTKEMDDWPEAGFRERVWLSPRRALARIDDEGLREVLQAAFSDRAAPKF
jgi:8-oxo-dGTP pyrophosphatase MutT (NUDIX family)